MSDRITVKNVRTAWALYVMACKRVGFDTEGWFLEEGSPSGGVAFRSYRADRQGTPGCPDRMTNLMAAIVTLRAGQ